MTLKELKFIHITKTGGTTIEEIGKENNIKWGRFHKEYKNWHEPLIEKNNFKRQKYDWFLIVRNPYDRIISELHCKYGNLKKNNILKKSNDEINKFIQECINKRNNFKDYSSLYCYGHYKEQYKYLCSDIKCTILKVENLKEDFNNLMKEYNLNITLNKKYNSNKKIFNVCDLNKETIELINDVYNVDFELFNYEKIKLEK